VLPCVGLLSANSQFCVAAFALVRRRISCPDAAQHQCCRVGVGAYSTLHGVVFAILDPGPAAHRPWRRKDARNVFAVACSRLRRTRFTLAILRGCATRSRVALAAPGFAKGYAEAAYAASLRWTEAGLPAEAAKQRRLVPWPASNYKLKTLIINGSMDVAL